MTKIQYMFLISLLGSKYDFAQLSLSNMCSQLLADFSLSLSQIRRSDSSVTTLMYLLLSSRLALTITKNFSTSYLSWGLLFSVCPFANSFSSVSCSYRITLLSPSLSATLYLVSRTHRLSFLNAQPLNLLLSPHCWNCIINLRLYLSD